MLYGIVEVGSVEGVYRFQSSPTGESLVLDKNSESGSGSLFLLDGQGVTSSPVPISVPNCLLCTQWLCAQIHVGRKYTNKYHRLTRSLCFIFVYDNASAIT